MFKNFPNAQQAVSSTEADWGRKILAAKAKRKTSVVLVSSSGSGDALLPKHEQRLNLTREEKNLSDKLTEKGYTIEPKFEARQKASTAPDRQGNMVDVLVFTWTKKLIASW